MSFGNAVPLLVIGVAIVAPLLREYGEFRRDWGLGRLGASVAALTLFPALGVGFAVSLPLAQTPPLQWLAIVILTLVAYSVATAAMRSAVAREAPRRSS